MYEAATTIDMSVLFTITAASNIMVASIAAVVIWALSRLMDVAAGVNFKRDILPQIRDGNLALGIYYGMRFLGLATTFGFLLSRTPI